MAQRFAWLTLVSVCALSSAQRAHGENVPAGVPRRVAVGIAGQSDAMRDAVAVLQAHTGLSIVATGARDEVPSRESILGPARRAYASMEFGRALGLLESAESHLIEGASASHERTLRLADVELFIAACHLLDKDRRAADERFLLARALDPTLVPDPIFPPEVGNALRAARVGSTVAVELAITPPDARVWIDSGPASSVRALATGLHYVVVERADRRPSATITRISRNGTRLELAAPEVATVARAQAALTDPTLSDAEGIELSRRLGTPVWRVRARGDGIEAHRWASADAAQPTQVFAIPSSPPHELERAVCAVERCDLDGERRAGTKPVWRRAWFWGVVGTGAAVIVGAVVAGAVVGTRPRDYDAVVR